MKTTTNIKIAAASAFVTCLSLVACDQKTQKTADQKPANDSAQAVVQPVRVPIELPIEADLTSISLPPNAHATSGMSDGELDPIAARFNPPVHLSGNIKSIKILGREIPLVKTDLNNGFLSTDGFGEIEVLLAGISRRGFDIVYRAFPADIEKIKQIAQKEKQDPTTPVAITSAGQQMKLPSPQELKQKPWPESSSITIAGTLIVSLEPAGIGDSGLRMIQRITLKSGVDQFVIRLFPGTKFDPPTSGKQIDLVVDCLKGGIPVVSGSDYEVEGLLVRKAITESLGVEPSTDNDQTKLAIERLVDSVFPNAFAEPEKESPVLAAIKKVAYHKLLASDIKENTKSEIILVRKLTPKKEQKGK